MGSLTSSKRRPAASGSWGLEGPEGSLGPPGTLRGYLVGRAGREADGHSGPEPLKGGDSVAGAWATLSGWVTFWEGPASFLSLRLGTYKVVRVGLCVCVCVCVGDGGWVLIF